VPEAFNPYREWLGVSDGRRPGNHYELLSIEPCEGDRAVIAQAADALTSQIRGIRPGPHMTEWQQLLGALAEAKRCLLDAGAKAAYDASLRGQAMPGQSAPPPSKEFTPLTPAGPSRPETPSPPVSYPVAQPIASPVGSAPPREDHPSPPIAPVSEPSAPAPSGPSEAGFPAGIGAGERHRRTRRRAGPSAAQLGVYGLTVVFVGMAVVLGYFLYQREQEATTGGTATSEVGTTSPSNAAGGLAQRPPDEERASNGGGTASTHEPRPGPGETPKPEERQGAGAVAEREEEGTSGMGPTPDEPPKPEKTVQPVEPPKPDSPAERERRQAVAQALADVRFSMAEHHLEGARGHLRAAVERATTPEEKAEADRLDTLLGHLDEFWKGMSRAVARLRGAEELKIGETIVVVVEASAEELTIKAAGQVRTYATAEMPFRLVEELADLKLGRDPATKVLVGTYHLVDPKGDPARTRRLWEEAGQGGLDVKDLMPELTLWASVSTSSGGTKTRTRAPLGAMRTAPPDDAEELKRAEEEVKATFKAEYEAATSLPGKSQLATALMEAAEATGDDAAVRFVLLREARDMAVAAGEGELACRAIDGLGSPDEAEVLKTKTAALADAGKKARGLDGQRQIAETALELIQEAVVAQRFDEAQKLAEVALAAARKMNSRPLMQQAMVAGQQVEALRKQK